MTISHLLGDSLSLVVMCFMWTFFHVDFFILSCFHVVIFLVLMYVMILIFVFFFSKMPPEKPSKIFIETQVKKNQLRQGSWSYFFEFDFRPH